METAGLTPLVPYPGRHYPWPSTCNQCGDEVAPRLHNICNGQGGCRRCGYEIVRRSRRVPSSGLYLAKAAPGVAAQFVRNLTSPETGPEQISWRGKDRCVWECPQGHRWEAAVKSRTTGGGCPKCVRSGQSRLEVEVGHLISAATGSEVRYWESFHAREVDLYVPSISLAIDLDPLFTHRGPGSVERDTRKCLELLSHRYVRVREVGLPSVPGRHVEASSHDPWVLAVAVSRVLREHGLQWSVLESAQRVEALKKSWRYWAGIAAQPPKVSAADRCPSLAQEFVANLTWTSLGLEMTSYGSHDRCVWRCAQCGHVWEAIVKNRTKEVRPTGCPRCRGRNDDRLTGSSPAV